MSNLADRLARDSEPWKPEDEDTVLGTVLAIAERDGGYGPYPVVTLETADGRELEIHAFHRLLRDKLASIDVWPGDQLGIRYLGQKVTADGSGRYFAYRVVHQMGERLTTTVSPAADPVTAPDLPGDELEP